ncbi:hypothetical protein N6H05_21015 [Sphingobium sp. WTD-1]|uniref:LexA family protein n=1 Tax=Sphingobium sp. WTD-1 TaxID=2979467 RepID=UPI0024DEF8EB|nr:hypothetical protein [Sphingobium sp. WTD-1]WIA55484.1 hypothetical protein N6H05_21015 [Sphingobium sp. WTD-1]
MTPSQRCAYDFIRDRISSTGVCPALTEIAAAMGVKSKGNAFRVVDALVRDGYLRRGQAGSSRNLRLVGDDLAHVATSSLMAELERRGVRLG